MKKYAKFSLSIFSAFIFLLATTLSCQKNKKITDELEENVFAVSFKIKDFESIVSPLPKASVVKKVVSTKASGNGQGETLFQWNFDLNNVDPIVALNPLPVIDYNDGKVDYGFTAGWPTTGKSISFRGAQSIFFKLPTQQIESLLHLSLDVNSSTTGPRAILIDYSTDKGVTFSKLSDTIHFPIELTTAAASKLPVIVALNEIPVSNKNSVWFRIRLYEGKRPLESIYNPTTGTFKIDNVLVSGVINQSAGKNRLYYHIYNAESNELVKQGTISTEENFTIDLPLGIYHMSVLTKNSTSPIIFGNSSNRNTFYISNSFKEKDAEIYAVRDTFEVKKSTERTLNLNRVYSEVKVQFTDIENLSIVDSIRIQQKHPGFYYYPFSNNSNSQLDASTLKIEPQFTMDNKSFFFNQFMGLHNINKAIKYELKVYANATVIRTFELQSEIKNNMQILFKGMLLEGDDSGQGFTILKNEKWDGNVNVDF